MDKTFTLEILTPHKKVYSGDVASLVAPGTLGYLGVLAHHAPMLVALVPGTITFRDPQGAVTTLRNQGGGFLEVQRNTATLLAETLAS